MVLNKAKVIAQLQEKKADLEDALKITPEMRLHVRKFQEQDLERAEDEVRRAKASMEAAKKHVADAKKKLSVPVTDNDVEYSSNWYGWDYKTGRSNEFAGRSQAREQLKMINRQLKTMELVDGETITIRNTSRNELTQLLGI